MTGCLLWRRKSARFASRCWHRRSFSPTVVVDAVELVLPVFLLPRCLGVCRGCVRGGGRCHRPQAFVGGRDATRRFFSVDKTRLAFTKREEPMVASALQWPLPRVRFVLLVLPRVLRLMPCIGDGTRSRNQCRPSGARRPSTRV